MLDRQQGKVIAYRISIDSDKNDSYYCRELINEVLTDCRDGKQLTYNNIMYGTNRNNINIIATDGNWEYYKVIKCSERKTVKILKDNKNGKVLKDKDNKIIR